MRNRALLGPAPPDTALGRPEVSGADFWSRFDHDPRDPDRAGLRAADRDREHVHELLRTAYAEGRLDVEELEQRTAATEAARTLGDLPPVVVDLVPPTPSPGQLVRTSGSPGAALTDLELVDATPDRLRARAVEEYEGARRAALIGFLGPTLICWAIWLAGSLGPTFDPGFPWPLIVTAALLVNVGRVWLNSDAEIEDRLRRLERRQRKLRKRLPPADGTDGTGVDPGAGST